MTAYMGHPLQSARSANTTAKHSAPMAKSHLMPAL
jgi:hypothetical protein